MPSLNVSTSLVQVLSIDTRSLSELSIAIEMGGAAMQGAALDVQKSGAIFRERVADTTALFNVSNPYINSITGDFPSLVAFATGSIRVNASGVDRVDFYVSTVAPSIVSVSGFESTSGAAVADGLSIVTASGSETNLESLIAGERNHDSASDSYLVAHNQASYHSWAHGDGDVTVTSSPALLLGVLINTTLVGDFAIRDGVSAAAPLLFTTANNATALTNYEFGCAIRCETGIFIDDNATGGNALILWRPL